MATNKRQMAKTVAKTSARTAGDVVVLILKILGTILLIGVTTGIMFVCIFAAYVQNTLSAQLDVTLSDFSLNQTSVIYYQNKDTGEWLELASLHGDENRIWLDYAEIPQSVKDAAVAIEDQRFYSHHGVDWYRTVGAVGNMFFQMRDNFGGSTLTQQLIKQITKYDDVTVQRKLLEIFRALDFEKTYTKEDILEWYLNIIYLGEGAYGIEAAAITYFDKTASELTLAEAACIVGITNNPSIYDPYISENAKKANKERQETILYEMFRQGYITEEEYTAAVAEKLIFKKGSSETGETSTSTWFEDAIVEDVISDLMELKGINYKAAESLLLSAGYKIYATIDVEMQDIVDEIYTNMEEMPAVYGSEQQFQSSIVILDPYTGDIVAMAGGTGEKSGSRIFNGATDMQRPPGSAIKPLSVYAPALDYGLITPVSVYQDSPDITLSGTSWYPKNYSGGYSGSVTIKTAVQYSLNTIAAQVLDELTPLRSYEFLTTRLGATSLVVNEEVNGQVFSDIDYAPLALGQLSFGITVREMAAAYGAFVNNGMFTESRTYSRVEDQNGNVVIDNSKESTVAMDSVTAFYINDMLTNVVNSGTGTEARFSGMTIAGKTGTTTDYMDRWFVGYTPYYVAAVWTGYETPEVMKYSGSQPACYLWKKVMEKVHENLENKSFYTLENLQTVSICQDTGLLSTEACAADIRGSRVLTYQVAAGTVPTSRCDCHVMVTICNYSGNLASEVCDDTRKVGVLDLSSVSVAISTPESKDSNGNVVKYILSEMEVCSGVHVDDETGWEIDNATGYLVDPDTGRLYDPVTGKFFDRGTGWEIDVVTGYLINPDTGVLHHPDTLEPYDPEVTDDPGVSDAPPEGSDPLVTDGPPISGPTGEPEPTDTGPPVESFPPSEEPPSEGGDTYFG